MEQSKDESKVKGAKARAEKLSPDQRREIAIKAASARWKSDIPKANYVGILKIADVEIPCAVYEKENRVLRLIVQREVVGLLTGSKKGNLDRYLQAQNLQPFVPEKFKNKSLDQATIVLEINGRKAFCYEGEDIVDLCKMYLNARKVENVLLPNQQQLADRAEIIIISLAKTGIVGLIDEATGYQEVRAKDALQAFLEMIIRKELAVWAKKFPDEFYINIYRLKNWPWPGMRKNRFSVCAHYTRDLVYERIAHGLLEELEKKSPKDETGKRKHKLHQWLTEDIGNPMLAQHLHSLVMFQRLALSNGYGWKRFVKMVDNVLPKRGSNLELPFTPDEFDSSEP